MGVSCSKSRVAPADPAALAFASAHVSIEKTLRADWEDQRRVIKCLLLGTGECGKVRLQLRHIRCSSAAGSPSLTAQYAMLYV